MHRLDEGTSGVLLFAKKPEVVKQFHDDNKKGLIKKLYHAITTEPVSLGEHLHYMKKGTGKMICL